MKKLSHEHGYANYVAEVELEDDFERKLNDSDLITYVDNNGSREVLRRVHEEGAHPGHFGGIVTRITPDKARVKVYID